MPLLRLKRGTRPWLVLMGAVLLVVTLILYVFGGNKNDSVSIHEQPASTFARAAVAEAEQLRQEEEVKRYRSQLPSLIPPPGSTPPPPPLTQQHVTPPLPPLSLPSLPALMPPEAAQWPTIHCETTKGDVTLRARPDWSPTGAARLLELVGAGYLTRNLFYRVPPLRANPIYQFGLQPNRELARRFSSTIPDDPPVRCSGEEVGRISCVAETGLERSVGLRQGMLGYGGHGKDSRTSHLWILRRDSKHLGKASWETPVAEVVRPPSPFSS